jgi:hypothetical protein
MSHMVYSLQPGMSVGSTEKGEMSTTVSKKLCPQLVIFQNISLRFITCELLGSGLEELFNADALLLGNSGRQTESLDAAAHTDAEKKNK